MGKKARPLEFDSDMLPPVLPPPMHDSMDDFSSAPMHFPYLRQQDLSPSEVCGQHSCFLPHAPVDDKDG